MASISFDNWLAICGIAVAVVAPVGQVLFQRRLEQRDREQRALAGEQARSIFMPVWKRRTIRAILYLLPAVALAYELASTGELSRLSVLTISICVASIFTMYLSQRLTHVMGRMLILQEDHMEVTSNLVDVTRKSAEIVATGKHRLPSSKPRPEARRK